MTRRCSFSTSRPTGSTRPASGGCGTCSATTPTTGTVLLSSHLLAEIEIIADDIVMIGQGRIVCQGSKAELLQAAGTVVRAADAAALGRALAVAATRRPSM